MKVDLDQPVSASRFAQIVGISRQAAAAMVRDGTLVKGDTLAEWLAQYLGHLREVAAGRADTPAAQHSKERILAAEAHRREEMAAMATQKRQQQSGELLPVDEVTTLHATTVQIARTRLWGWQSTLPPLLYGQEMAAMGVILERELRDVLDDMAANTDEPIKRLTRWIAKHAPPHFWRDGGPMADGGGDCE